MTDDGTFSRAMERVEQLIAELEREAPAATLEPTRELLRAVLDAHGSALKALLDAVRSNEGGDDLVRTLCEDPSVAALLALHDLHPAGDAALDHAAGGGNLIPVERLHAGRGARV